MRKNILFGLAAFAGLAFININSVYATEGISSYADLKACLEGATGDCTVAQDIAIDGPITVTNKINLNLEGHTLAASSAFTTFKSRGIITVAHGADLTINGEGEITTGDTDVYCAIRLTQDATDNSSPARLTTRNVDLTGYYYAITGNGSVGRDNTIVEINGGEIKGVAKDDSAGLFLPQAGETTINGASIIAASGIAIKSGTLTLNDSVIMADGAYAEGVKNNNGFNNTGAGIQIETNTAYAGNIKLYINNTYIRSNNSHGIYEFLADPGNTELKDFKITTVEIESGKAPIELSRADELRTFVANGSIYQLIDPSHLVIDQAAEVDGLKAGELVQLIMKDELSQDEQDKLDALNVKDLNIIGVFEINLFDADGNPITSSDEELTFTFGINEDDFEPVAEGYNRVWYIIRFHDGKAERIPATFDSETKTLSFKTSKFSTYVGAYVDVKSTPAAPDSGRSTNQFATVLSSGLVALSAVVAISAVAFVRFRR
ncbi:hypothetical protein IJF86_00380 [Candidatus Saccharibacteria bacterium]|nr:hypothetical protein [Candidatus Saccharibacteria bacterium]